VNIALFPLPYLVLFPTIVFPLHIFEERYKLMMHACVEEQQAFGLVLLRAGAQEETDQTIHRAGTTARVMEVEQLDGGRMNIVCQGESRFRVSRFIPDAAPYWKASVDFFEDDPADPPKLETLHSEVAAAYKVAFDIGVQLEVVSTSELRLPESPEDLSFMISYALDIEAEEKQKLLEMRSTEKRLRSLLVHIEQATTRLQQQLVQKNMIRKVRGNGDLGRPGSSVSSS